MNILEAKQFFEKLGVTAQELEELYSVEKNFQWDYVFEEKEKFIKRKAASLKECGLEAVKNKLKIKEKEYELFAQYKRLKEPKEKYIQEREKLIESVDDSINRLEKDFSKKFYCAFVRNTKYSIPVKLRGEEYVVTVPKTVAELMKEGFRMNNCLTARAYWMALGTMKFFFIRKKDNIEAPLIDVILSKDNRILWVITKNHENVRGDNKTVFNRWYKTCFGHTPTKADYVPRQEWFKI